MHRPPHPPTPATTPAYDLAALRAGIPLLKRFIPLNNCSQAPQTRATRAAAEAFLDSWDRDGMDWDRWMDEVERARAAFARFIGASPDEVAVSTSVSAATASVASALHFEGPRNRVVLSEGEFPTVGHVWLAHRKYGVEPVWVPVRDGMLDPGDYRALIDERTRVVSATHGYYLNGYRQDLRELADMAHRHGALLFVDAYQTLGTTPVDVKALDIDMLAAGTLKYLMGTPGLAFLYVRRSLLEKMEPSLTGWFGRTNPFAFDPKRLDWAVTARRFDTGTPPVLNAYVARAGLELLESVGVAEIERWTRGLSQRLVAGAEAHGLTVYGTTDPDRKTPTTAIRCPGDSHAVEIALREEGILASARGPVVRLAPHFYNTLDEMDRAVEVLARILDEGPDA